MAIGDDFSVAVNGDIRHVSGSTTYTVLQFHRWLQDLADDAVAAGNDLVDISSQTPSERATDNIITLLAPGGGVVYNIDDTAAQYLYDGSITQNNGDTVYSGLVVVGSVEAGTNLQIVQDNALLTNYWGSGLNADAAQNILLRIMVKTRVNGADIDGKKIRVQAREFGDTYSEFNATLGVGNSTAAIFTSNDLNNETAVGTVATYDQFTNTEGYQLFDVTGDGTDEEYYSKWTWGAGATPASPVINDLYEWTKYTQRRGTSTNLHGINGELFRGITHQWAYQNESGTGFIEDETVVWGTKFSYDGEAGATSWTVGEYLAIGTAVGKLLYVDDQGTTGTMVVAVENGATLSDNDVISQLDGGDMTANVFGTPTGNGNTGGSGLLLALDDNGTTGFQWIQLTYGSPPANTYQITGLTNGTTADVNGSVTTRTVSPEYLGTSTGSALIGAFGVGVDPTKLLVTDKLFDLTNVQRTPPNNVTFEVLGLVSGEDRVLVGPRTGSALNLAQFTIATTALTTANITSVEVNTTIPSDTPASGTIRVEDNAGVYRRLVYTSYTGATFTIDPTASEAAVPNVADFDVTNASIGNNVFISYIDALASGTSASFTSVYSSDRALFIRVRDGGTAGDNIGIKTFETSGTLFSTGGSTTAIRTSDA